MTSAPTQVPPGAKFTPRINPSLTVTADQMKEDYQKPEVVIWDVRSRGEYVGDATRGNRRPGHVPNAVHLEWLELVDDDTHLLNPLRRLGASWSLTASPLTSESRPTDRPASVRRTGPLC